MSFDTVPIHGIDPEPLTQNVSYETVDLLLILHSEKYGCLNILVLK